MIFLNLSVIEGALFYHYLFYPRQMRHSTQELENADSLLASVTSEEERQEARVQNTRITHQTKEQETAQLYQEEETKTEEKSLATAREELRTYAETEPKSILEASEKAAHAASSTFESNAKKNAKKVESKLLSELLSLSFLSHQ